MFEGNVRLYNKPEMVAAYSGKKLRPSEEQIFRNLPRGKLLDLGCGSGRTTVNLARMGFRVVGVDISEAMIAEARRLHPEIDYRLGDACDLSGFKDGEFEYVLFSFNGLDLLHPYEMRVKCLREIHRVLRDGGLFIYSSHNEAFTTAHPDRNKPLDGGYVEFSNPNGPEVVYTTNISEQAQQLKEVGLQIQECYTGDIFNYYVAKKARGAAKIRVVKPPSKLLLLPGRILGKLWRVLSPPVRQTMVIDLTKPYEVLWGNVKKTRRNEIEKGLEDLVFVADPAMKSHYLAFEKEWSSTTGLFPLPVQWLKEGHLFVAYTKSNGVVAGLLAHKRGKALVVRRDSSLREYEKVHAALTWRAIRWARGQGFKEWDQGGYNEEKYPEVSFYKSRYGGRVAVRRAP